MYWKYSRTLILLLLASNWHSALHAQFVIYENFERYGYPNKDLHDLKNNVKTVYTRFYNASADDSGNVKIGTRVGSSAGFEYLSFDKQGRILLEGNFYKDSVLDAKMTYTYNDAKRTLTVVRSYLNEKEDYRLVYNYNPSKMQIAVEEKHAVYPAINKSFVMQYDKDSAIETISYFNKSHELVSIFRYTKNDTANTVSRQELLYGTTPGNTFIYHYSASGYLAKREWYSSSGNLEVSYVYEYDDSGNAISYGIVSPSDGSTHTVRYVYTFDEKGNWITRHSYEEGVLAMYTERTIEYY